jgi:hypothetical protein
MINDAINDAWISRITKEKISDQALLASVCSEIMTNVDFSSPFSDFQENVDIFDFGENLQKFKEQVVLKSFENYLNSFDMSLNDFNDVWVRGWITGMRDGYHIAYHNHSGASLSAIFYLLVDDSSDASGGELVLCDPRANANRGYLRQFKKLFADKIYKPMSGEFLVFPSYVYHYSNPYSGKLRLAMPVDLYLS